MAELEINGTTLYYEDTGPGSTGETIAFMHGLLWSTEQFAPQVAALRDRYRCISWDHRGQGRSAADHRRCIGIELVWQDAVALLDRLAAGAVHLVGLSMGGFVAMRVAARCPERVRTLHLLETSADPEPIENVRRYRMLTALTRVVGVKPLAGKVAPIMLGQTVLGDPARKNDVARFNAIMSRRRDIWRAVNGVVDRAGCYDELVKIAAPTQVLVGDEDVATPRPKAERIVAAIAGARLVPIPRAGHSSPVEEPTVVTAAIEAFLRGTSA